jgi:hypothetical protein
MSRIFIIYLFVLSPLEYRRNYKVHIVKSMKQFVTTLIIFSYCSDKIYLKYSELKCLFVIVLT